jgi:hypothetical protein
MKAKGSLMGTRQNNMEAMDAMDAVEEDARKRFGQLPERFRTEVRDGQLSVYRAWANWWHVRRQGQGLEASAFLRATRASMVPLQEAATSDTPAADTRPHIARVEARASLSGLGTHSGNVDWRRVCLLLDQEGEAPV